MDKKEQIEKAAKEYIESKKPQWTPYHKQTFIDAVDWALSLPKEVEPKKDVDLEEYVEFVRLAANSYKLTNNNVSEEQVYRMLQSKASELLKRLPLQKPFDYFEKYQHEAGLNQILIKENEDLKHELNKYLQNPVESDSVEFADYLESNWYFIRRDKKHSGWVNIIHNEVLVRGSESHYNNLLKYHGKSTQEVYEQFKQLKK